jgi:hypothetical protein
MTRLLFLPHGRRRRSDGGDGFFRPRARRRRAARLPSEFPVVPRANTNFPALMTAEKMVDAILELGG